jgi:GLPGLI family protein
MKSISIFILLIFGHFLKPAAQNIKTYQVNYQAVFNIKYDIDKQYRSYQSMLLVQQNTSHFIMLPSPVELPIHETIIESDSSFRVIKHSSKARMVFGEVDLAGRERYFEDTLHSMRWSISEEVRMIDSFQCRRANTRFRGRDYVAWYCPDIPIPNGPWKMGGLPGLIVELKEKSGDMHFLLQSIQIKTLPDIVNHPIMRQKHPDIQGYLEYWRKLVARMKGMAAAQPGTDCLTCETTPSISIRKWEKFNP